MTNNLILGYGQLGKELVVQTKWDYISRDKNSFDFCDIETYKKHMKNYDTIINCIANIDTYGDDKYNILKTNFSAVCDLVDYCNYSNKKLVHISSLYVYAESSKPAKETDVPVHAKTWYSYSKLLADGYIEARSKNYLIIRTCFKPYPCIYEWATIAQHGNFDYINKIATFIIKLIDGNADGIFNVGTEAKTIYDLAMRTNKDVIKVDKMVHPLMPKDITADVTKMIKFLEKYE